MYWIIFLGSLLFTVIIHEVGHLLTGLFFKVNVEVFSVGFWKPNWGFKWKGIRWQITPWLLGGFCKITGETTNELNGLMAQKYWKKCVVLLAGVFMNLIVAFICYWINYKNIFLGIYVDLVAIKSCFTEDYTQLINIIIYLKPNLIVLQLSLLNIFCAIANALPYPALDGSYLFLYLMKPVWKENYIRNLQIITKIGFWSLMVIQALMILWIWF